MASISNNEIKTHQTPTKIVKLGDPRPGSLRQAPNEVLTSDVGITISLYNSESRAQPWDNCRHSLLLSSAEGSRNPFFSQGCVYVREHEELYITSNLLQATSGSALPLILFSKLKLRRNEASDINAVEWQKLRPPPNMPMPAGGVAYGAGIVFASQGNLSGASGGLYFMPRSQPPSPLVTSYYGRDFNSPNDVALARDGSLWFTDPCHGFEKDFRKKPQLPCHLYRFHPEHKDLRVMADGLARPTGVAFSPDEATLYVTDTDALRGDGNQDPTRAATIYAFDVILRSGSPFLSNKRTFAYSLIGIPMGLKCDAKGYVYAGCADGVEVWSPGGRLEVVIEVPGGVTNLSFGKDQAELFLCAEQRLWRLDFGTDAQPLIGV